eukprot:4000330-Pleurochrysis_carterae.AAC.3
MRGALGPPSLRSAARRRGATILSVAPQRAASASQLRDESAFLRSGAALKLALRVRRQIARLKRGSERHAHDRRALIELVAATCAAAGRVSLSLEPSAAPRPPGTRAVALRALTPGELAAVAAALGGGDAREKLAEFENIPVTRADMASLKGLNWLNDEARLLERMRGRRMRAHSESMRRVLALKLVQRIHSAEPGRSFRQPPAFCLSFVRESLRSAQQRSCFCDSYLGEGMRTQTILRTYLCA